jgi:hypothetical protein
VTAGESQETQTGSAAKTHWLPLVALSIAQFVRHAVRAATPTPSWGAHHRSDMKPIPRRRG